MKALGGFVPSKAKGIVTADSDGIAFSKGPKDRNVATTVVITTRVRENYA